MLFMNWYQPVFSANVIASLGSSLKYSLPTSSLLMTVNSISSHFIFNSGLSCTTITRLTSPEFLLSYLCHCMFKIKLALIIHSCLITPNSKVTQAEMRLSGSTLSQSLISALSLQRPGAGLCSQKRP